MTRWALPKSFKQVEHATECNKCPIFPLSLDQLGTWNLPQVHDECARKKTKYTGGCARYGRI